MDPVTADFETAAGGFFTAQKLKYFDELAVKIEPDVKTLDPSGVNLTPLTESVDALEAEAKTFERKVRNDNATVHDQINAGAKLLNESNNVNSGARQTLQNIESIIFDVQKLADSVDASENTKVENAVIEANEFLEQLKELSIDTSPSEKQLENASNYLNTIENLLNTPVKKQTDKLNNLHSSIGNFSKKLEDLNKNAAKANEQSKEAERLHAKNKDAAVNSKFETVNNHTKETQNNIEATNRLGKEGNITLGDIYLSSVTLGNVNNELKAINSQVDLELPDKQEQYDGLENIITEATDHRTKLDNTVSICMFSED